MNGKFLETLSTVAYRPFRFAAENTESGFRIGGFSPRNVTPAIQNRFLRYLLTMPVCEGFEVSIFYSFDFDSAGDSNPFDTAWTMFDQENPLVQVCFHASSARDERTVIHSEIPGRRLILSEMEVPEMPYDECECYPFHKIGGVPFFVREFDSGIKAKAQELLQSGFVHLVQLAFPVGPEDVFINADWPFGDAAFHVFTKKEGTEITYKYCWG
jgi:hypothetical protein